MTVSLLPKVLIRNWRVSFWPIWKTRPSWLLVPARTGTKAMLPERRAWAGFWTKVKLSTPGLKVS